MCASESEPLLLLPLEVVFQKHKTALGSRDAKSIIDKLWLMQVTSGGGLRKLQARLEELCLPKRGKTIALESAVAELQKIKSGKLYSVLTKASQGQINSFEQWLTSLKKVQQPTVLNKPAEWLAKVWALLPNYFVVKFKESVDGTEKELLLRGVPALKRSWNELKELEDEEIEMASMDALCCYLPWLDTTDAKAISQKRADLLKQRLVKSAPKAAPKQKGKQVKETAEKKAKDAAMAFLKKKQA
eukprot:6492738-Amphidinium_carterae.2